MTKVVHSKTKEAWNIIGTELGGKYKIARVPYVISGDELIDCLNKSESLKHAIFISKCFNDLYKKQSRL